MGEMYTKCWKPCESVKENGNANLVENQQETKIYETTIKKAKATNSTNLIEKLRLNF